MRKVGRYGVLGSLSGALWPSQRGLSRAGAGGGLEVLYALSHCAWAPPVIIGAVSGPDLIAGRKPVLGHRSVLAADAMID
jgi:hypothetical protein